MRADLEGAILLAARVSTFNWTWTIDDLESFGSAVGWHIPELGAQRAQLATNLDIARPIALVHLTERGLPEMVQAGQTIEWLTILLSDIGDSASSGCRAEVTDLFCEFEKRLTEALGRPDRLVPGAVAKVGWDLPRVSVSLVASDAYLSLRLTNPSIQRWLDNVREDAGMANIGRNSGPSVSFSGDWDGFTTALALLLPTISVGTEIMLGSTGGRSVCISMRADRNRNGEAPECVIRCDIARNSDMDPAYRFSGDQYAALENAGWSRPTKRRTGWYRIAPWPGRIQEYQDLSKNVINVLMDYMKISDPTELEARLRMGNTAEEPDVESLGIPVSRL